MTMLSKPPNSPVAQRKRLKKRPKTPRSHSDRPALIVGTALSLGFLGLIAHSIFMANVAYLGIKLTLSGGSWGWILGLPAVLISVLSTLVGLGVIFIPNQTLAAIRLMVLASLTSLAMGLLLWALGIQLLPVAGAATACFWLSAIATMGVRHQRHLRRVKKSSSVLRYHR